MTRHSGYSGFGSHTRRVPRGKIPLWLHHAPSHIVEPLKPSLTPALTRALIKPDTAVFEVPRMDFVLLACPLTSRIVAIVGPVSSEGCRSAFCTRCLHQGQEIEAACWSKGYFQKPPCFDG